MKDQSSPYRDDVSGSANVCWSALLGRTGNDLCARHQPITQRVGRKEARMRAHILRAPPNLAERVGFEPTNTREDVTGIPVQRLRPLGHLSASCVPSRHARRGFSTPRPAPNGARIILRSAHHARPTARIAKFSPSAPGGDAAQHRTAAHPDTDPSPSAAAASAPSAPAPPAH